MKEPKNRPVYISESMHRKLRLISTTHSMFMGEMVEYLIEGIFKQGVIKELTPGIDFWHPEKGLLNPQDYPVQRSQDKA